MGAAMKNIKPYCLLLCALGLLALVSACPALFDSPPSPPKNANLNITMEMYTLTQARKTYSPQFPEEPLYMFSKFIITVTGLTAGGDAFDYTASTGNFRIELEEVPYGSYTIAAWAYIDANDPGSAYVAAGSVTHTYSSSTNVVNVPLRPVLEETGTLQYSLSDASEAASAILILYDDLDDYPFQEPEPEPEPDPEDPNPEPGPDPKFQLTLSVDGALHTETLSSGYYVLFFGQYAPDIVHIYKSFDTILEDSIELDFIEINSYPDIAEYFEGEPLDITGLAVTAVYTDGTSFGIDVTLDNISGYNSQVTGVQAVTVTYNGKTASFPVTVKPILPTGITVTHAPAKTEYFEGEALNLGGLVVTASYNNGTSGVVDITMGNISGYNSQQLGTQTVTVTYSGFTAAFTVKVNPILMTGITVTAPPVKTIYVYNSDPLDITGLVVTASYNNGTTGAIAVTLGDISGYNNLQLGPQTLTVTCNGFTAAFTVTVIPISLSGIEITALPARTVYYVGDTLDRTGLVVTAVYNNGSTKPLSYGSGGYSTAFDFTVTGTRTVTVSYEEDSVTGTAEFTVTVNPLNIINLAAIQGLTPPAAGAAPVTAITETAQYSGTVAWSPSHAAFSPAAVYTATVTLTAKYGYTLQGVAADFFTVAGTSAPAASAANSGVITAIFPATAATVSVVAIPGVTAPVAGAAPVTAITETAQYTGTVAWSPAVAAAFAANTAYTAAITLTPKTGFTLYGLAANSFTVAGASPVTNAANSGAVTAAFPKTAATISSLAIPGVTRPATGEAPVTAIDDAQYSGTVTWSPAHSTFAAATVYTATVTLAPKSGFTLYGIAANSFTVAGASPVTNSANSGAVTAVFPATNPQAKFISYWSNDQYEIIFSPASDTLTLSLGATSYPITPSDSGYTGCEWSVNGIADTGQTGSSYTFSSAGRETGKDYIISLLAYKGGVPYSGQFTVRIE